MAILKIQEKKDPDAIFGTFPTTCDLEQVFGTYKEHYRRQGKKSGDWSKDRVTTKEDREYKKLMGYQ